MAGILNARTIHLHDTEDRWNMTTNFIPKQGEVIVYDVDGNYSYERFKIGDGKTDIKDLPFTIESELKNFLIYDSDDDIFYIDAGNITEY